MLLPVGAYSDFLGDASRILNDHVDYYMAR